MSTEASLLTFNLTKETFMGLLLLLKPTVIDERSRLHKKLVYSGFHSQPHARGPQLTCVIPRNVLTFVNKFSFLQARVAARRYARVLQKLNFKVRFQNYRVVNVLGTCKMPWAIKIIPFSEKYKKEASYEPELHPGVTYNLQNPTATLKIFTTGSMTVTGESRGVV